MPKIFLTGDLHGPIDIEKLHHNRFTRGQNLTKNAVKPLASAMGI